MRADPCAPPPHPHRDQVVKKDGKTLLKDATGQEYEIVATDAGAPGPGEALFTAAATPARCQRLRQCARTPPILAWADCSPVLPALPCAVIVHTVDGFPLPAPLTEFAAAPAPEDAKRY